MSLPDRPLSPHLQVYKPQVTSVLSIFHRISGVIISLGALFLAIWLGAIAYSHEAYISIHSILSSWLGQIVLFLFTVALFYHLCNGVRHLFWDLGKGLEIVSVYRSGWTAVVASLVLTAVLWVFGYASC